MARLSDLVIATSSALGIDKRSVNLCARYLREAGLISQKGRGPSAAHMAPQDAANLLLGIMASDTIKDSAGCVKLAREATYIDAQVNHPAEVTDKPPPYPFLKEGDRTLSLGEALDQLIDEVVRYGDLVTDDGGPLTNFFLSIERPGLHAEVSLDDGSTTYIARYHRVDPRLEGLKGPDLLKKARQVLPDELSYMKTTTTINMDSVSIIADVLRGYEPSPDEIVHPPYAGQE